MRSPWIVGAAVLFGGCAPQEGDACESDSGGGVEQVCSGGQVLECVGDEWVVKEQCTCDGFTMSCAIPGFVGIGRARGWRDVGRGAPPWRTGGV